MNLRHHRLCGLRQQGSIANELDSVAQSVEAPEQHAFAGPRFPIPYAIRIRSSVAGDPIALFPGALQMAQQHPTIPACRGALILIESGTLRKVETFQRRLDLPQLQ